MTQEPKVYIALEDEDGQLVIDGPLSLFDRLVATMRASGAGMATPVQSATSEATHE